LPVVQNLFLATQAGTPLKCQSNVAECQDILCLRDYFAQRMTLEEIKKRILELARIHAATHNPEIREEIYRLARELEKMEKLEKQ
jgi:hypothetical protein